MALDKALFYLEKGLKITRERRKYIHSLGPIEFSIKRAIEEIKCKDDK